MHLIRYIIIYYGVIKMFSDNDLILFRSFLLLFFMMLPIFKWWLVMIKKEKD